MDSLVERVEASISEDQLLKPGERVLVGLSGGADSIVLTHILLALEHPTTAVHVNYGLRGAASDDDEAFVRNWCESSGVDLVVKSFDAARIASERGLSVQHAARDLRYETFSAAALETGVATVAVGHHRDDQAETVLINLFRGTGLEGLAGMPVKRSLKRAPGVTLVRPLLNVSRKDIESYARVHRLDWQVDASNTKTVYRRGALRSEILPVIERHFGASTRARIAQSAELVRAYLSSSLEEELQSAFDRAAERVDGHGTLKVDVLAGMRPVIRRRIIIEAVRRWLPQVEASASSAEEIEGLLDSQPGRRLEWGGGEVWRERDSLLFLSPRYRGRPEEDPLRLGLGGEVELERGTLRAEMLSHPPENLETETQNQAFLDAHSVTFPLVVRPWADGDRFSPLGMEHSKKVSDFLTDEHIPPHRKRDVYVVLSKNRIVWVVGHRIAHSARVRSDTTETVRLSYHPVENY